MSEAFRLTTRDTDDVVLWCDECEQELLCGEGGALLGDVVRAARVHGCPAAMPEPTALACPFCGLDGSEAMVGDGSGEPRVVRGVRYACGTSNVRQSDLCSQIERRLGRVGG